MLDTQFWKQEPFSTAFVQRPTQLGQVRILKDGVDFQISSLPQEAFLALCLYLHRTAHKLKSLTETRRVGLASDHASIYLLPMHGLAEGWQPMRSPPIQSRYSETYRGDLDSCSGPRQSSEALTRIQRTLCNPTVLDTTFTGDSDNLFAKLIRGDGEQYRFYDQSHVALLTPFPHSPGCTVVLPREHLPSDIFSIPEPRYLHYVEAVYEVMKILKARMGLEEVAIFFEGYEIDMAHIKLYPIPAQIVQEVVGSEEFYEEYPGFLTTRDGPEMSAYVKRRTEALLERIGTGSA